MSSHVHCFFEFFEKLFLAELNEILRALFPDLSLDVQACRSKRTCLKYITEEDRFPYFNVKVSSLHFNYRAYLWACSVDNFSFADPFVLEHRFCYKFLMSLFEEVKFMNQDSFFEFSKLIFFLMIGLCCKLVE